MVATVIRLPTAAKKMPPRGGVRLRKELGADLPRIEWVGSEYRRNLGNFGSDDQSLERAAFQLRRTPELALVLSLVAAITKNELSEDPVPTKVALLAELRAANQRLDCPALAAALSFAERL